MLLYLVTWEMPRHHSNGVCINTCIDSYNYSKHTPESPH